MCQVKNPMVFKFSKWWNGISNRQTAASTILGKPCIYITIYTVLITTFSYKILSQMCLGLLKGVKGWILLRLWDLLGKVQSIIRLHSVLYASIAAFILLKSENLLLFVVASLYYTYLRYLNLQQPKWKTKAKKVNIINVLPVTLKYRLVFSDADGAPGAPSSGQGGCIMGTIQHDWFLWWFPHRFLLLIYRSPYVTWS